MFHRKPDQFDPVRAWYARRGLSSLLAGTPLLDHTSVRAAPMFLIVFLLIMLVQIPSGTTNLPLAIVFAMVSIVIVWVGGNTIRGRRLWDVPRKIGRIESLTFFVVPVIAVTVMPNSDPFGGILTGTELTVLMTVLVAIQQFMLWALLLLFFRFGVIALFVWLTRHIASSIPQAMTAMSRTLPVLLGVVMFFEFTAEMWQSVGRMSHGAYTLLILLLVVLGGIFIGGRGALNVDRLATFRTSDEVRATLAKAPDGVRQQLSPLVADCDKPVQCPMSDEQEFNLRLVSALSRLVIASTVGLAVFVFFIVFGLLTVSADTVEAWTTATPEIIVNWQSKHHTYALTVEHLQVSGFLAAFSAFYYVVVSVTDRALRDGLDDTAEDVVREACAIRLAVLQITDRGQERSPSVG